MNLRSLLSSGAARFGSGAGLLALAGSSFAAVDTTAASAGFTDAATAIGSIGPLMLTAVAAGIVYKWVTAFLI